VPKKIPDWEESGVGKILTEKNEPVLKFSIDWASLRNTLSL
jgi:hypothetical protein